MSRPPIPLRPGPYRPARCSETRSNYAAEMHTEMQRRLQRLHAQLDGEREYVHMYKKEAEYMQRLFSWAATIAVISVVANLVMWSLL